MEELTLLIASPGLLTTQHLESRTEPDNSQYIFTLTNLSTSLVKLTNVQLTLVFDFSNQNLTINGVSSSIPGSNPIVIDVDDLLPGIVSTVTLDITANAGGSQSPVAPYAFTVLATYDTEPWPNIVEPVNISGGAQLFFVVPD